MLSIIQEAIILKINQAVNNAIDDMRELNTDLDDKLSRLDNKSIRIDLNAYLFNLGIIVKFDNNKILVSSADIYKTSDNKSVAENTHDLNIKLTLGSTLRAGITDIEHAIRERDIEFTGDLNIAMELQKILNNTEYNFKDILQQKIADNTSDYIGWMIISILSKVVDRLTSKQQQFKEQVTDYLQIEKNILVNKYELEDFYNNVDSLRDDVARLQARLTRLNKCQMVI